MKILIETDGGKEGFEEFEKSFPDEIEIVKCKQIDASETVTQALVALNTLSLPLIVKIIIEHIRSKKSVVVKYKGVTLKGMSEKRVERLLKKIISKEASSKKDERKSILNRLPFMRRKLKDENR